MIQLLEFDAGVSLRIPYCAVSLFGSANVVSGAGASDQVRCVVFEARIWTEWESSNYISGFIIHNIINAPYFMCAVKNRANVLTLSD